MWHGATWYDTTVLLMCCWRVADDNTVSCWRQQRKLCRKPTAYWNCRGTGLWSPPVLPIIIGSNPHVKDTLWWYRSTVEKEKNGFFGYFHLYLMLVGGSTQRARLSVRPMTKRSDGRTLLCRDAYRNLPRKPRTKRRDNFLDIQTCKKVLLD